MDYVERFKYDGYCVIPNIISEDESDKFIDIVKNVIQSDILVRDYKGNGSRIYNISQVDSEFKSLYSNPILQKIAKDILKCDSLDVWRDRLFLKLHPPIQNSSIVKCSPNKTLTCYLCLDTTEGIKIIKESHLHQQPIQHDHHNSIEGEGTAHEISLRTQGLRLEDIEPSKCCAIFVHNKTVISGGGNFNPRVAWEYIDSDSKNIYSTDEIEHGRFTL